jgi:hypothetical protein
MSTREVETRVGTESCLAKELGPLTFHINILAESMIETNHMQPRNTDDRSGT